jgi:hypothetical protein
MNAVESRFSLFPRNTGQSVNSVSLPRVGKLGSKASSKFVLLRSRLRSALALVWAAQNPGWNPAQALA